ncbi:MAG: hypothetical protein H5U29_04355 [Pusillimonas sp.]|nr:hypothetical protein [Pusillimonas sp.]
MHYIYVMFALTEKYMTLLSPSGNVWVMLYVLDFNLHSPDSTHRAARSI